MHLLEQGRVTDRQALARAQHDGAVDVSDTFVAYLRGFKGMVA